MREGSQGGGESPGTTRGGIERKMSVLNAPWLRALSLFRNYVQMTEAAGMSSRDSEPRRSMGPPVSSKASGELSKQRGPNPQTDYKRHFNRTKERFDLVNKVSGGTSI